MDVEFVSDKLLPVIVNNRLSTFEPFKCHIYDEFHIRNDLISGKICSVTSSLQCKLNCGLTHLSRIKPGMGCDLSRAGGEHNRHPQKTTSKILKGVHLDWIAGRNSSLYYAV